MRIKNTYITLRWNYIKSHQLNKSLVSLINISDVDRGNQTESFIQLFDISEWPAQLSQLQWINQLTKC